MKVIMAGGGAFTAEDPAERIPSTGTLFLLLLVAPMLSGCGRPPAAGPSAREPLLIAAASNLSGMIEKAGQDFARESDIPVAFNFGATAQLAQQIEHGAPFDLFLAADVEHVDKLAQAGRILPESRAVYARGRLVLWVPPDSRAAPENLSGLRSQAVRFIAIANPETAPYGAAAEQLLRAENLWDELEAKLVRADNVTAAKQMAATGNAEVAFTAYSLVRQAGGRLVTLDPAKTPKIDQALGIPVQSPRAEEARKFATYLLRGPGRDALRSAGYDLP